MERKKWIGAILILFLAGCAAGTSSVKNRDSLSAETFHKKIKAESEALVRANQERDKLVVPSTPEVIDVEPVIPSYDPLEDHIVSFSMVNEDIQMVLYSLSKSVGINLIMDPSINMEERLMTLNFEKVSAATVLREILNTFDLYYETSNNVIRIKPFQERIFSLNFLDSKLNSNFDVGGDVLGVGESGLSGGLSGSFRMTGKVAGESNAYDWAEKMVKQVLSGGGKYSLNRMSGTLYVKDTPAAIHSISKLIHDFKDILSRQILIETRIIEVGLLDEYKYGIDWSAIRDMEGSATKLMSAAWNVGQGLLLTGVAGKFSIDVAIDALKTFGDVKVVSNPTIRSKHGKPSMLSVGTSFSYIKSVSKTKTRSSAETDETTEVDVSTVFDGLILGVVPFIEKGGKISLLINPIKSDVDQESLEPVTIGDSETISLPIVRIKEFSATISLNDGDVVILGGLIDKDRVDVDKGVPILSDIPGLGYLFKNKFKRHESRELVVILSVSRV